MVVSVDDRLHGLASRYMASPQWVKTLVGGAYAAVPRSLRHGPAYARFRKDYERKADESFVNSRLAQTLSTALLHVPAFAEYKSLASELNLAPRAVLERLPLMSKEDVKRGPERYVNSGLAAHRRLPMFTGGSTSIPMRFYLQRGVSRAKELAAFDFMAERFGTDGPGVVLALRGQSVPEGRSKRLWMYEPIKRHLILSSDHLEPAYMRQYVEALQTWQPRYVQAFPSALYPIVLWLRENGRENLLDGVRSVTLYSESVYEHHMAAFKQFFRCPVVVHYGHTERAVFALTLPNDPRYHVLGHYGYAELIDAAGQPVTEPGRVGEIVATSFDNQAMPFVRYRTGDYAVLGSNPNLAMEGSMVLDRIEGRIQEYVVCADHRLVTVTTLGAAHIREFELCSRIQYEQSEPGHLKVRVVSLRALEPPQKQRICEAIEAKTQGGCRVALEEVDFIELTQRGKQRLLIQGLDLARYLGASLDRS